MSDVQVHLIEAAVHGRYLLRPSSGPAAGVLVGFHGYGESAAPYLEALLAIPGIERWTVAAIQGLHPFYTRTGEVVASWMTKLDRDQAIADNTAYVRAAVREILATAPAGSPLVYSGFSQGVAMAYRAAAGAGHPCHGLIALAGDVPPELAASDLAGFPRVLIGRGASDSWYSEEKLTADVQLLRGKGVEVEFERFDGGHEWTPMFHRRCGDLLAELSSGS
jgi:predicted esterase